MAVAKVFRTGRSQAIRLPTGPAPGLGGLRRGAGGVGRLVWRVRSGGGLPTLSELATMLGLSRAESVPNLTRRFDIPY
jgi:hypothetical protein